MADCPSEPFYPVLPDEEDTALLSEIDSQREKWTKFIESRGGKLNEEWLWQYWRAEFRPKSQIFKKAMSLFSTRLSAQKKIKTLMRRGLPPELRGRVWWACSGAAQKKHSAGAANQYDQMLGHIHELEGTIIAFDIEKDLHRTFPEDPRFSNEKGITTLRRVLSAYAVRNPEIGYCQSMNYICAMLLFHLSEERAFWVLAALLEDILPNDYYSRSMIGGRVDQQVFQSCIAWKLPQIHAVLKETKTGLEPVTTPWFLCLFINTLPMYTVCRIWDCLFWEGSIVVFRVALACMKLKQKQICECTDIIGVYMLLKSGTFQATYNVEDEPSVRTSTSSSLESAASTPSTPTAGKKARSKASQLLKFAFGKSWLRSMPRQPIDDLRVKIREMLVESDRSVEARRHLINATKPTKAASLLANKSKSMAIRPAASAAVTARPVSAPATSATTSATGGEGEEEPLPGDEAEEGDGEGEEDEEEAGAATGPNPSASKAQLAGHVSMLRAKDIHSELILQALNSQSGVGLVELADRMNAGIGHDSLAQEHLGGAMSVDEDDGDHDDQDDEEDD